MQVQTVMDSEGQQSLETRFGKVAYSAKSEISFPAGIVGMPGQSKFVIAEMPDERMRKFQVMQSLVEDDISFAVLPLESLGDLLEKQDLDDVCEVLNIAEDSLLVMLITSIHKTADGNAKLSVNLRAPVFIDVSTKRGHQLVLPNSKYPVQHYLQ